MTMRTRTADGSRRSVRTLAKLAAVAMTGAALSATLIAPADAGPRQGSSDRFPARIALPNGFQPEGITIQGSTAYLGSRADGGIFAADLKTGRGRVISQGPGTASVGLKVDGNRLYVSGGGAGTGRVINAKTGRTLASYRFTANPSFVNDVVLTKRKAWFTDSLQAQLYSVPRDGNPAGARARTVPLIGDWVQTPGVNNANGIAETPDRKALLVVQSNTGLLFRVNPKTGVAREVDLGGYALTNGDGLLVRGRTLYVVQNRLNKIAVINLNAAGTRGTLTKTITSPDFDVPTTVAFSKGGLYLPNARFGIAAPEAAEYWITRVNA